MPRKVDVGWYLKYLTTKKLLDTKGENTAVGSLADVAESLGIKLKTLNRMMAAGRYLDRIRPATDVDEVACSYVGLETLEQISRLSSPLAAELLPGTLTNTIGISDLKQALSRLRQEQPSLSYAMDLRAGIRQTAKMLAQQLDLFMSKIEPDFFGAPKGTILKASQVSEYLSPRYVVVNEGGTINALVFNRIGGESRSAFAIASELYDLAKARHACGPKPKIWIVFPSESEVMLHLAEIALWAGGSPFNGNWLFLAYTDETNEKIGLRVLYEFEYGDILVRMKEGKQRVSQEQLQWSGMQLDEETVSLDIGYSPSLPEVTGTRTYHEVLTESARARMKAGVATLADKSSVLETDLGL